MVLNRHGKFTEDVTLEQIAVLSERDTAVYYLWNQYFTMETLGEGSGSVRISRQRCIWGCGGKGLCWDRGYDCGFIGKTMTG